jgi:hypothetical protein
VASPSPALQDSTAGVPGPVGPPAPATSPPGRRPRRVLLPAVAVIVVAVLLVIALLLTGVIPGLRSGSSGHPREALSYSAARSLANAAAGEAAGGPWTLFSAGGYDLNSAASFGLAFVLNTCFGVLENLHYLTSARPAVPAFGGSLASGLSPWWLFGYDNGTTSASNETIVLAVVVVNGTATPLATFSSGCDIGAQYPIPNAGIIDSPVALAAAVTTNSSFFAAHPGLNASFGLSGPAGPAGRVWGVYFTSCAPFDQIEAGNWTSYTGWDYGVGINATTGIQSLFGIPGTVTCSSFG